MLTVRKADEGARDLLHEYVVLARKFEVCKGALKVLTVRCLKCKFLRSDPLFHIRHVCGQETASGILAFATLNKHQIGQVPDLIGGDVKS